MRTAVVVASAVCAGMALAGPADAAPTAATASVDLAETASDELRALGIATVDAHAAGRVVAAQVAEEGGGPEPEPDPSTIVLVGITNGYVTALDVTVGRDAIYLHQDEPYASTRRLLELPYRSTGDGIVIDVPRVVAVTGRTSVVEHDGELSWTDPDGDLVIRATDGTTTRPPWGAAPSRMSRFNARWTVDEHWVGVDNLLFSRHDGHLVDLNDHTPGAPGRHTGFFVWDHVLLDGRVAYLGNDTWYDPAHFPNETNFQGVWTMPLDASGPAGAPLLLDGDEDEPRLSLVGATDGELVWRGPATTDPRRPGTELRWTSASEPTTGYRSTDPSDPAYPSVADVVTGSAEVFVAGRAGSGTTQETGVSAHDLSGPSLRLVARYPGSDGRLEDARGGLLAHRQYGIVHLTDTTGGSISLDDAWQESPVPLSLPPVEPPVPDFPDVPREHPFSAEITWLRGTGLTTGHPDGSFRATDPVTRQATAAFLHRYAGAPEGASSADVIDVPPGAPFADAIDWLVATGTATGYADGTFRPAAPVSRQAMAAFLYRAAGSPDVPYGAPHYFGDVPRGHPFEDAITWLATTDISTGYRRELGGGAADLWFRPDEPVSRQAMAAFLHRFHQVRQGMQL